MPNKKFWAFRYVKNEAENPAERELVMDGPISDESWWGDEVTPEMFRTELFAEAGPVTVWINSPGGDVFAASEIYTMLREYAGKSGKVTVKIDALAASAASVIAMAGDSVQMAPTAMMMIHNPATIAMGDAGEMQKTIEILNAIKEAIINAYETKTGLSRSKLARMMDEETWMDARVAKENGFCDEIMYAEENKAVAFNMAAVRNLERRVVAQIAEKTKVTKQPEPKPEMGRPVAELMDELKKRKR